MGHRQLPADFRSRWPLAIFSGELGEGTEIGAQVLIENGASIDLTQGPRILGRTHVRRCARIMGNPTIVDSTVDGFINGGHVHGSWIVKGATVRGGYMTRTIVQDGGQISDGDFTDSIVWGGVHLTRLRQFFSVDVYPDSTGKGDYVMTRRRRNAGTWLPIFGHHQTVPSPATITWRRRGDVATTATSPNLTDLLLAGGSGRSAATSAAETRGRPIEIRDEFYISEPPEELIDSIISHQLIHEAVIVPSGHSYDLADIMAWLAEDGRDPITRDFLVPDYLVPNRALQRIIDKWKKEHRTPAPHRVEQRT